MGGKRPDQYAIDPGEAGATDYKDRRQEEFIPEHKEHFVESRSTRQGDSLIPQGGVNPALAELQARKERDAEQARGESHREGGLHGGGHGAAERHQTSQGEGGFQSAGADEGDERQPLNAQRDESRRAPDAERTE